MPDIFYRWIPLEFHWNPVVNPLILPVAFQWNSTGILSSFSMEHLLQRQTGNVCSLVVKLHKCNERACSNRLRTIRYLVKWLGHESSNYAISIRASNIINPSKGLTKLWSRLDGRCGSPEKTESSLKTRVSSFPKLSTKANVKLYELADLFSEILYV